MNEKPSETLSVVVEREMEQPGFGPDQQHIG
jgi:hypothetical protein